MGDVEKLRQALLNLSARSPDDGRLCWCGRASGQRKRHSDTCGETYAVFRETEPKTVARAAVCECCGQPCDGNEIACEICRESTLAVAHDDPGIVELKNVYRTLGWVANHICNRLDVIEDKVDALRKEKR